MVGRFSVVAIATAAVVGVSLHQPAAAVNVVIDYTYDTSNFFGAGNPSGASAGAQARASLDAVGDYFSTILDDSLSVIQTPDTYVSSAPGGSDVYYEWSWEQVFDDPTTDLEISISNPTIPADEYRIYAGARLLGGSTLGVGGPGAYSYNSGGSYYFSWQLDEIRDIGDSFESQLETRGEPVGEFGRWGGTVTFDTDSNWHYDHTSEPTGSKNDFFSVALHEIGHALGVGASDQWNAFLSGGTFNGPNAIAANGGTAPGASTGHWQQNLQSTIFGTSTPQEVAMDPNITNGDRKLWTTLDAAGLADIGWTVIEPPGLVGDYNDDLVVDAIDYAIWRESRGTANVIGSFAEWQANYGASLTGAVGGLATPEPASLWLLAPPLLASFRRRQ